MEAEGKRVCLLTGAGGTLGSAFCRLQASNYAIAAVYRRRPLSVATQRQRFVDPLAVDQELPENEHPVFCIQAELAREGESERIVDLVLARFGRIDLLVNAAVLYSLSSMLHSQQFLNSLDDQFRMNAVVPVKLAAAVARAFWRDRDEDNRRLRRNVVNVSSIAAIRLYPGTGRSGYSATKAALNVLSSHMADEFSEIGVRVNAVAPNTFPDIIPTEMVVEAIAVLDRGRMTGRVIVCDASGSYEARIGTAHERKPSTVAGQATELGGR